MRGFEDVMPRYLNFISGLVCVLGGGGSDEESVWGGGVEDILP